MVAGGDEPGRIVCERAGAVLRLAIDNPRRRNAMTSRMWRELARHCRDAAADPEVRVVALTGSGDVAFCAGADISEFAEQRSGGRAAREYEDRVREANEAVSDLGKPAIALVNGACYGGGMGLAMRCDVRLASARARFCIPAAKLGLGYPVEDLRSLLTQLGPATVADLFFSARVVDAQEARASGIVQAVWPAEEFKTRAAEYLDGVSANAPLTIFAVKKCLAAIGAPDGAVDASALDEAVQACFSSADYQEGQAAFRERRRPVFRGI